MAASMLIPTVGVIALLGAGLVSDIGMLMTIEHVVMLPSMLIVMLLRRDQYSHAHAAADQVALTR
jgi:flagellar biosynthetic protein FliP